MLLFLLVTMTRMRYSMEDIENPVEEPAEEISEEAPPMAEEPAAEEEPSPEPEEATDRPVQAPEDLAGDIVRAAPRTAEDVLKMISDAGYELVRTEEPKAEMDIPMPEVSFLRPEKMVSIRLEAARKAMRGGKK